MGAALRLYDGGGAQSPPDAQLPFDPIQDPDISDRACRVLWALCYWAWGRKPDCWPSNGDLAKLVKCEVRTVQRALDDLERRGYIGRRMVPDERGWHRVITLRFREPRLAVHRPDEVESGGDGPVTTPPSALSPPPVTAVSHQGVKGGSGERELPATGRPRGRGPTPPAPEISEKEDPEAFHRGNLLSADDREFYAGIAAGGERGQMAVARAILRFHDRAVAYLAAHGKPAVGSLAKGPPRPAEEPDGAGAARVRATEESRTLNPRFTKAGVRQVSDGRVSDFSGPPDPGV